MKTETISFSAEDPAFSGYLALPDRPNGDAMIILHEIFGVNDPVKALTRRYAEDGYVAVAPDMLWRLEPGLALGYSREETLRAMAIVKAFDLAKGVEDLGQVVETLRRRERVGGKICVLGLCMGGTIAFLAASRLQVDAAISFYGTDLEQHLDSVPKINCPIMLHYGGKDRFIPQELVAQIAGRLAAHGHKEVHIYPEGNHGFYTRGRPEDIDLARRRTAEFLRTAFDQN
jgi:carboxymethylenebutenolidase